MAELKEPKTEQEPVEQVHHPHQFSRVPTHDKFTEPEPILDSSCDFEKMDRGEGMAVDDVKTYHRTER
ncbi:MAG TPA: hypothetical protein VGL72_22830 [Bryobacteraceae bacterium]|jgi:hypothetical protein